MRCYILLVSLSALLTSWPTSPMWANYPTTASEGVKIEITGKLTVYRHLLFGHAAVGITVDKCRYWLDYSKNDKELEGKLALSSVTVAGNLEFRETGFPPEAEDIVVGKRQAVIVVKSITADK